MKHVRVLGYVALFMILVFAAYMVVMGVVSIYHRVRYAPDFDAAGREFNAFTERHRALLSSVSDVLALGACWILFTLRKENLWAHCRLKQPPRGTVGPAILLGVGLYVSWIGAVALVRLDRLLPPNPFHQEVIGSLFASRFWILLLAVGLIGPFSEEILYRGIIYRRMRKEYSPAGALVLQALLFGVLHIDAMTIIYASFGGIVFGLSYTWTKSIWIPVAIHIAMNCSALGMAHVLDYTGMTPGTATFAVQLAVGLLASIYGLRRLRSSASAPGQEPPTMIPPGTVSRKRKRAAAARKL